MPVQFANNASATLASSITAAVTVIAVQTGQGAMFPSPSGGNYALLTLVDNSNNIEIVRCTSRTGDSFTVLRGQEGTAARAYASGSKLELRPTAAGLGNMAQVDANNTFTGTNTFSGAVTFASPPTGALSPGMMALWPVSVAPSGFLICNGQAVSRATYAALFAVIGTVWGAGDGSTTFNVPNYTDRMPIGVGTIATAAGATGGSKDAIAVAHTHTFSTLTSTTGSHNHTVNDLGHTHGFTADVGNTADAAGGNNQSGRSGSGTTASATTGIYLSPNGEHQHSVSGTTASSGSSGTNANLPPYAGTFFIIKT